MSVWHPRAGYEVAYVDGAYLVLVLGGTHAEAKDEPTWRVVARCQGRDNAFAIRDALRTTLPAEPKP